MNALIALTAHLLVEADSVETVEVSVMTRRCRRRHDLQLRRRRQLMQRQRIGALRQRIARKRRIRPRPRKRDRRLRHRDDVTTRVGGRRDLGRGQRSSAKQAAAWKTRALAVHNPVVGPGTVLWSWLPLRREVGLLEVLGQVEDGRWRQAVAEVGLFPANRSL